MNTLIYKWIMNEWMDLAFIQKHGPEQMEQVLELNETAIKSTWGLLPRSGCKHLGSYLFLLKHILLWLNHTCQTVEGHRRNQNICVFLNLLVTQYSIFDYFGGVTWRAMYVKTYVLYLHVTCYNLSIWISAQVSTITHSCVFDCELALQ